MPTDPWQKLIQQWSENTYQCSEPFADQELQNLTKAGWDLFLMPQPPEGSTREFAWWGGLFYETKDNKTYADWYVRRFCSKLNNSSQTPESRTTANLKWSESETLSNGLAKALLEELNGRLVPPNSITKSPVRFRVLERSGNDLREVVVFVELQPWKLASQLIAQVGSPPEIVSQDWQAQLKSFATWRSANEMSAAETLVAKDGKLLPLTQLLADWAKKNALSHSMCERDVLSCAADWPWKSPSYCGVQSIQIQQDGTQEQRKENSDWLSVSETTNLTSRKTKPVSTGLMKSRKSSSKKVQAIAIVATGAIAMAALLWCLLPNKPNETPVDESLIASSQVRTSGAEKSPDTLTSQNESQEEAFAASDSIAPLSTDQELTQGVAELTTTPGMESMSPLDPTSPSPEVESHTSIASLLSQFQPGQEQSTALELLDSASVISNALSSNKKPTEESLNPTDPSTASVVSDGMPTDPSQVNDDAIVPTEIASDTKDLPVSVDGTTSIEQTIVIDAAIKKTVSSIGKPVIPKKCSCEFELKLNKDLSVEPAEVVTIEGEGKATWRIAIEDEEPELILEIRSKPGNRWNHTILVGLRPSLNEPVVLIAPRDAQNVGNRLVQYIQWIDTSILTLQTAKANVRGRSPIDFVGEIKKLERQRREAEQAIERWKVVERLSYQFYDENQIQIKMSATIK